MFDIGFPIDWSSLKKLIWLKAAISGGGASAVWKTVTGTLIHITDALASPMQKCEVTLEPIQDLHGQDAPYPAGGGENLLPVFESKTSASGNVTLTSDGNGSYILNGTAGNSVEMFSFDIDFPAGSYTLAAFNTDINSNVQFYIIDENVGVPINFSCDAENKTKSATLSAKATIFRVRLLANTTATNFKISPMLVSGSTAPTTFSPYSNVCPITGWTGCEATRAGKNVFDGVFQQGTFTNEGLESATNTRIRSNFIPVSEGTIAISTPTANALIHEAYAYNSSKTFVRKIGFSPAAESQVSTIQSGESFIRFSVRYTDNSVITPNDNVKAQVEFNQTATDYELYSGTTLSVTFPDTVYGGKYEFVSGSGESKWVKCTYDGSENWGTGANYYVLWNQPQSNGNDDLTQVGNWLIGGGSSTYSLFGYYRAQTNGAVCVGSVNSPWEDVTEFKAYLSQNPLEVCYELAEPIEIQLTPQQISTLKGVNNVWSNGDSVEITYKAQSS